MAFISASTLSEGEEGMSREQLVVRVSRQKVLPTLLV